MRMHSGGWTSSSGSVVTEPWMSPLWCTVTSPTSAPSAPTVMGAASTGSFVPTPGLRQYAPAYLTSPGGPTWLTSTASASAASGSPPSLGAPVSATCSAGASGAALASLATPTPPQNGGQQSSPSGQQNSASGLQP